jgi:hypothetical protein
MMLDKVKDAVRVKTERFEGELSGLIVACLADLKLAGIKIADPSPYIEGAPAPAETPSAGDPLIERAIILYAKANFGYMDPVSANRFGLAYHTLKRALVLSGDYREDAEANQDVD